MSNDLIAGSVLLVMSLALGGLFVHFERRHRRIVRGGQQVLGTCKCSSGSHSGTGGVVHFNDHNGRYHRLVFMAKAPGVNGAKVTVFYDAAAPHNAVVAEARFNHVGWLIAALVALGAGGNWLVQGVVHTMHG